MKESKRDKKKRQQFPPRYEAKLQSRRFRSFLDKSLKDKDILEKAEIFGWSILDDNQSFNRV